MCSGGRGGEAPNHPIAISFGLSKTTSASQEMPAATFSGNALIEQAITPEMLASNFTIGKKVILTKRVSAKFTPDGVFADVLVQSIGFIKGSDGDQAVVTFTKMINDIEETTTTNIKLDKLKLADVADTVKNAVPDAKKKKSTPKGMTWLAVSEDIDPEQREVEVVKGWGGNQAKDAAETKLKLLHSMVGFSMSHVLGSITTVSDKQVCICKRGEEYEVWTLVDFAPGELVFGPETNEWKDTHWSQKASALLRFDTTLHPERKQLVLDGRLRVTPTADGRSFSILFVVTRVENEKETNMQFQYIDVQSTATIKLPVPGPAAKCTFKDVVIPSADIKLPSIPIMWNPKKIGKHTMLTCGLDVDLQKLNKKTAAARVNKLKQDQDDGKKAKRAKVEDGADG